MLFFYLNIFSLVFWGKELWCKCDFCKSWCQTLFLVKVLSGLFLSQQEKKNKIKIYPNQLQKKMHTNVHKICTSSHKIKP